jgi:ribonuclease P protein component
VFENARPGFGAGLRAAGHRHGGQTFAVAIGAHRELARHRSLFPYLSRQPEFSNSLDDAGSPRATAGMLRAGVPIRMTVTHPERLGREHRLRSSRDFHAVQTGGTPFRGKYCILLVLPCPGEPTRFGFITSRRSVGNAVQRNRARRRLREIARRRFPRMPRSGFAFVLIANREVLAATHQELATDVEHLFARAGALAPIEPAEH